MLNRTVRNHARQDQYMREVEAFYGPPRTLPPCPNCQHDADLHPMGGPCDERGCTCQGIPLEAKPVVSSNSYENSARLVKAGKLANLAQAWHIHSYDVAGWSDASWGMLADAARVKIPSEDTRAVVIQMLRDRELAGAKALEGDRR